MGFAEVETSLRWLCAGKLQFQPGTPPLVLLTSPLTSAQFTPAPRKPAILHRAVPWKQIYNRLQRTFHRILAGPKFPLGGGAGGGRNRDEARARQVPAGNRGWGLLRVKKKKKPGRCPGDVEGGCGGIASHSWGCSPLSTFVVTRVQTRRRKAWEAVSKLQATCLQFRFRNFRDLWVQRVGWDSGKGRAPAAGRAHPPSFRCSSQTSQPPGRPLRCLPGPRARACSGVWGSRSRARPRLRRASSPRRVLLAPAAQPRRIRTHWWETAFDAGRPFPNPHPSPLPSTLPRPSSPVL